MLCEHGQPIASSKYYATRAAAAGPRTGQQRDEQVKAEVRRVYVEN